jgi:hypothetical protein
LYYFFCGNFCQAKVLKDYYDSTFLELFENKEVLSEVKKSLWPKIRENIISYVEKGNLYQYLFDKGFLGSNAKQMRFFDKLKFKLKKSFFNNLSAEQMTFIENFGKYFLSHEEFFNNPPMIHIYDQLDHTSIWKNLLVEITGNKEIDLEKLMGITVACFDIYSRWNMFILEEYLMRLAEKNRLPQSGTLFFLYKILHQSMMISKQPYTQRNSKIVISGIQFIQDTLLSLYYASDNPSWAKSKTVCDYVYHRLNFLFHAKFPLYSNALGENIEKNVLTPKTYNDIVAILGSSLDDSPMSKEEHRWKVFVKDFLRGDTRNTIYV